MKWAIRLAVVGIVWTLLTLLWVKLTDCGPRAPCELIFVFLNPLTIISAMFFGAGSGSAPAIFNPFVLNGLFGFFIGLIADFICRRRTDALLTKEQSNRD